MKKVIATIFLFLFLVIPAQAANLGDAFDGETQGTLLNSAIKKANYGSTQSGNNMENLIRNGLLAVFSLLGAIFVILIIIAGYRWITAGGNEEKLSKAKRSLTSNIIGLLIIIASYAIVRFVLNFFITNDTGQLGI